MKQKGAHATERTSQREKDRRSLLKSQSKAFSMEKANNFDLPASSLQLKLIMYKIITQTIKGIVTPPNQIKKEIF